MIASCIEGTSKIIESVKERVLDILNPHIFWKIFEIYSSSRILSVCLTSHKISVLIFYFGLRNVNNL